MAGDAPTPLALMLSVMRSKWDTGDVDDAVALAKAIAPYLHPKAPAAKADEALADMRDDRLDELCEGASAGSPAGGASTEEGDPV